MAERIEEWLTRWQDAGILDAATAVRIREFESSREPSGKLRWPVLVALAFGGIMLGAGILLFVALIGMICHLRRDFPWCC